MTGSLISVREGDLLRVTITGTTSITSDIAPADFSMVQALLDDVQASHDFELTRVEKLVWHGYDAPEGVS